MALAELSSESETETETETGEEQQAEEEADDDAASLTRHLCQADDSEEEELEVFSVLPRESRSRPQRLCPAPMPSRPGAAAAVTQPPRQEEAATQRHQEERDGREAVVEASNADSRSDHGSEGQERVGGGALTAAAAPARGRRCSDRAINSTRSPLRQRNGRIRLPY
eukprot:SAG25_NODE_6684_length_538_cov_1.061503_1_plen_166_part_01